MVISLPLSLPLTHSISLGDGGFGDGGDDEDDAIFDFMQ